MKPPFGSDVIIDPLPFLSTWSLSITLKALWRVNIILRRQENVGPGG